MKIFDYIVVGSGCSGAMAAQTLVEAGKRVLMVDVGEANPDYAKTVPDKDYLSLRGSDPDQYKYLVGSNAEGVEIDDGSKGAQVTPPRGHMLRNTKQFIPLESTTFAPLESLGYGGLGIGWGLQCWQFSRTELIAAGMDADRMMGAYETVAKRIGVSGTNDDAAPYTLGELRSYQPSPEPDANMRRIYAKYQAKHGYFNSIGMRLGRTPLALLTKDMDGRKAYAYRDMDFYDDNGRSAWRPWVTIDKLRKHVNFSYSNKFLALSFTEDNNGATIHGLHTETKQPLAYTAKTLILASGALGTARIALRSQGTKLGQKIPLLCNPYTYVPCFQPAMFGAGAEKRKIGFGQLSGFLAEEADHDDTSIMTLYSYQSLMQFRVIKQIPLNFRDGRSVMQHVSPGLIVSGIQHSDRPTSGKFLRLQANAAAFTGDELQATYTLNEAERADQRRREDIYIKAIRRTGLYALKKLNPGHGSSVHYAGTMPFSSAEKPLGLAPNGRVHGTRRVYVADSSGFNFLPARGLTFSLLANAHITAENILHETSRS